MLRDRSTRNMLGRLDMERHGESLGRGVVVLGMHRSGTSAVTGVIDSLGLPACPPGDRFPSQRWNARGNYEAARVTVFDEQLLNLMDGTWWAPPPLRPGWASRSEVAALRPHARDLFAAAHPAGRWVWKDPRACLLMPFWDSVVGADTPRIVVLRNPLESAASLLSRNGIPRAHAFALTERYLRTSLRDSAGRSVLITTYDELLGGIDGWCRRTAAFLKANGIAMPQPLPLREARGFVDGALRHHRELIDPSEHFGAAAGLHRLWNWAIERRGVHDALSIKGLPRESTATATLIRGVQIGFRLAHTPELVAPRG
jgi:hypothetical protein